MKKPLGMLALEGARILFGGNSAFHFKTANLGR